MTCQDFREQMRDLSTEAREHQRHCRACAARLEDDRALSALLASLASEPESAPPRVEAAVLAAFRARRRRRPLVWFAAAAAAVAASAFLLRPPPPAHQPFPAVLVTPAPEPPQPPPAAVPAATVPVRRPASKGPVPARQMATEFIPMRPGPLLDPDEFAQVVRIRVPRADMRRFGFPMDMNVEPSAAVTADVVLGRDGTARAIRFLH